MIETPILITEEYWKNSVLSTARFYGHVKAWGHEYVVVNKEGKDIYECTHQANKEGRAQAIPAGQPCDLVDVRYVHIYRKVGRATFIEWVKEKA